MLNELQSAWVYLSASPLLHLTLTLIAFQIGTWLYQRCKLHPLVNPVLIAIVLLVVILKITDTTYSRYFEGAQFVHFLLGPATVSLAIPLYRHLDKVRSSAVALLSSIICGSLTSALSAIALIHWLGGSQNTLISIAPKSVTAPVAMGITEKLGGLPSLTAVLVILTGILGAMFGPIVLNICRINDWRAHGLALGTASHGIGTARALQVNETAGAFSGLAMGINALATSILLPILWQLLF